MATLKDLVRLSDNR